MTLTRPYETMNQLAATEWSQITENASSSGMSLAAEM